MHRQKCVKLKNGGGIAESRRGMLDEAEFARSLEAESAPP
jgi:hypothetical protein